MDRVRRARQVLDRAGIAARVRAAGFDGDIAAVQGPSALREPLARLAPELRSLGFRYVALELDNEGRTPTRDS